MNSSNRKLLCRVYPIRSFIFAVMMVLVTQSYASPMKYLEVEDLTQMSSHVFRGEVISVDTVWAPDHQSIQTIVKVKIAESYKGSLSQGQTITINQIGGEIDGIRTEYEGRPIFNAGEQVVLFTKQPIKGVFVVTALKQGRMSVEGDSVVRDFSGLSLITKDSTSANLVPVMNPRLRIPLTELRTRVIRTR